MDEPVVVQADGDTPWSDFDIPDGNIPVSVSRLHTEAESFTLFVRFPAGWKRGSTGYYESGEDFLILDGALTMTGQTYGKGDWVHVPAGAVRAETSSESGALSLARFGGPARWIQSSEPPMSIPLHRDLAATAALTPLTSPLGPEDAWLLRDEGGISSWLLEPPPPGTKCEFACEFLDLARRVWCWVPVGAEIPYLEGLCFCRMFEGTGGAE